jgi:hypothetical protein
MVWRMVLSKVLEMVLWTSLDMHPNQPIGSVADIHLAVPSPAVVRQKCIY